MYAQLLGEKMIKTTDYSFAPFFSTSMKKSFASLLTNNIANKNFGKIYILCPLFNRNNKWISQQLESKFKGYFSVGVTGTVKIGETPISAMFREIGEELGVLYVEENPVLLLRDNDQKHKRTVSMYSLNMNKNFFHVPKFLRDIEINSQADTREKIGCYAHGTKTEIKAFLSKEIHIYKSPDSIIGVTAVQIDDILQHYFQTTFIKIRNQVLEDE